MLLCIQNTCFLYDVIPESQFRVRAFEADIGRAYIILNIAVSLNLLLCGFHRLTQLSDMFFRVSVGVVGQLALMVMYTFISAVDAVCVELGGGAGRPI